MTLTYAVVHEAKNKHLGVQQTPWCTTPYGGANLGVMNLALIYCFCQDFGLFECVQ